MDCDDGDHFVGVSNFIFLFDRVLVFGGGFVCRGIFGDFDDGGDEYDCTESRAGRVAEPGDGGVRDDVYGSAADWVASGGRGGEAYWGAADVSGVWGDCVNGERGVCGTDDDEDADGGDADGGELGGIGAVQPFGADVDGGLVAKLGRSVLRPYIFRSRVFEGGRV